MGTMDDLELLQAAIAVALADGELRRSEKGVIEGLARRAGVGRTSFQAMLEAAEADDGSFVEGILIRSGDRARQALELLVAQARIDGEISVEEREVLVRLASALDIKGAAFREVYEAGITRADALRKSRGV